MSKIDIVYLNGINKEENLKEKYFGGWIKNVDALAKQFNNTKNIKLDHTALLQKMI